MLISWFPHILYYYLLILFYIIMQSSSDCPVWINLYEKLGVPAEAVCTITLFRDINAHSRCTPPPPVNLPIA